MKGNLLPAYESGILIIVHNVEVSCWRKHEQDIRWMGTKVKRFRLFYYSNGISAMTGKVGVKVK